MNEDENDKPRMIRDGVYGDECIPWFLHSHVNPPTDPLTIQLLALVEDLPCIPGPQTVGPENYHRIFAAFKLREPLFSRKSHRNILELLLGTKSLEQVFAELNRQDHPKPE